MPSEKLIWFLSKDALSNGVSRVVEHPSLDSGQIFHMGLSLGLYSNLGHAGRGLEDFPKIIEHPLFRGISSATTNLSTDFGNVYRPINAEARKFAETLSDPYMKRICDKQLTDLERLAQLAEHIRVSVLIDSLGDERIIQNVAVTG